MTRSVTAEPEVALELDGVGKLISLLSERGYQIIAPALRDGAITFDTIENLADLPAGWTDVQRPGRYRLENRADGSLFAHNAGPRSLKNYLHPAEILLFEVKRNGGFGISRRQSAAVQYAFFGVRACDLAALAIHDRVLLGDRYVDDIYQERRAGSFIVAVQCTTSTSTCFCASMGTGPRVEKGADIVLTEVVEPAAHAFVARAGSARGKEMLEAAGAKAVSKGLSAKAASAVARAKEQPRHVDVRGLREAIYAAFDDTRWDEGAAACLACGNCTQVCPTCFCTTVEDTSTVRQNAAQRWRRWDSCFTESFSYIHGGSIRLSLKSRYRQRMIHKFASWEDQFGTLGCVGCGRCTTWCPAGIDVVEEIAAVRRTRPAVARVEETAHGIS